MLPLFVSTHPTLAGAILITLGVIICVACFRLPAWRKDADD